MRSLHLLLFLHNVMCMSDVVLLMVEVLETVPIFHKRTVDLRRSGHGSCVEWLEKIVAEG